MKKTSILNKPWKIIRAKYYLTFGLLAVTVALSSVVLTRSNSSGSAPYRVLEVKVSEDNFFVMTAKQPYLILQRLLDDGSSVQEGDGVLLVERYLNGQKQSHNVGADYAGRFYNIDKMYTSVSAGSPLGYLFLAKRPDAFFFHFVSSGKASLKLGDEVNLMLSDSSLKGTVVIVFGSGESIDGQRIGINFNSKLNIIKLKPNKILSLTAPN
jgi:hypothetical protein